MILVNIKMPTCCGDCPFLRVDGEMISYYCAASGEMSDDLYVLDRDKKDYCPIIGEYHEK